jgi:hypothetical protein
MREGQMEVYFYGACRATIANTGDPVSKNRVEVRIPSVLGGATQ